MSDCAHHPMKPTEHGFVRRVAAPGWLDAGSDPGSRRNLLNFPHSMIRFRASVMDSRQPRGTGSYAPSISAPTQTEVASAPARI